MSPLRGVSLVLITLALLAFGIGEAARAALAADLGAADGARAAALRQEPAQEPLDALATAWVKAAKAHDFAALASLYAEDAVMVAANGEEWEGRGAIEEGLEDVLEGLTDFETSSIHGIVADDLATNMGTYTQTMGEDAVSGYYMVAARKQGDGSWKLVEHIATMAPPQDEGM